MNAVAEWPVVRRHYDIHTNQFHFRAIQDIVLIKPDHQLASLTESNVLVLPESEGRWSRSGVVVAVGPGVHTENGFVSTDVKEGDRVLYNANLHTEHEFGDQVVKLGGETYVLTRERELLAVVGEE